MGKMLLENNTLFSGLSEMTSDSECTNLGHLSPFRHKGFDCWIMSSSFSKIQDSSRLQKLDIQKLRNMHRFSTSWLKDFSLCWEKKKKKRTNSSGHPIALRPSLFPCTRFQEIKIFGS